MALGWKVRRHRGLTRRMSTGSVVVPHRCRVEAERANGLGVGRGGDMCSSTVRYIKNACPRRRPFRPGGAGGGTGWRV